MKNSRKIDNSTQHSFLSAYFNVLPVVKFKIVSATQTFQNKIRLHKYLETKIREESPIISS